MKTYSNDELTIVQLTKFGVTRKKIDDILQNISVSIYEEMKNPSDYTKNLLSEEKLREIMEDDLDDSISRIGRFLKDKGIGLTTIISPDFPESLKTIKSRPVVLYYVGDITIANDPNIIGIVGTRKPTGYGRETTKLFVKELIGAGIVTASGLAYGIDSEVARHSTESRGKTIAVLGGGLCNIYPSSNIPLAGKIVKTGGVIISEYYPTEKPTQYTFPDRNRIISGLSRGVLVVEAGAKSGSLITAKDAIAQGKKLFVVPGNITSSSIEGSNELINKHPETFTISPRKIFESLGMTPPEATIQDEALSPTANLVIMALSEGVKTTDDLCEILKEDYKTTNLILTDLEISGIIRKLPGDQYCRNI